MKDTAKRTAALSLALLFSAVAFAWTMSGQSQTTTRKPSTQTTPASNGEYLFNTYCAVCHGKDGKGNGPAAASLKTPPADLATLTKRHGGKFPTDYVTDVLQYGVQVSAHGSKEMPIWGTAFNPPESLSKSPQLPLGQERQVDANQAAKIHDVTQYIESLQVK